MAPHVPKHVQIINSHLYGTRYLAYKTIRMLHIPCHHACTAECLIVNDQALLDSWCLSVQCLLA